MSDDEKPIAKFLRLKTGDDVISEVVETEDEEGVTYILFNPLKVIYLPMESAGTLSIAFMPWVFPRICDEQEFILYDEDVLLITPVSEKMNIYYWETVDSYIHRENEHTVEDEPEPMEEEEQELYNDIMDKLGIKRTYH